MAPIATPINRSPLPASRCTARPQPSAVFVSADDYGAYLADINEKKVELGVLLPDDESRASSTYAWR